ncbi:hypothetical protein SB659_11715 [Arthrobacter sp. SIMBA_036]
MQAAATDSNRDGRWTNGGTLHIPNVETDWTSQSDSQVTKVQVIQDAIHYFNRDGTEGRPSDAATNDAFAVVAKFRSSWKVVDTGVIR